MWKHIFDINIPDEISNKDVKTRYDLETYYEEADNIIIQQVLKCKAKAVSVVSDDIDMFILWLHYYHKAKLTVPINYSFVCINLIL